MADAVKAIFASDSDCAELLADILTGQRTYSTIYCVLHNCQPCAITTESVRLSLCLPLKRPGCAGVRCLEVFRVLIPSDLAYGFLFNRASLPAKLISSCYSKRAALEAFQPILEVLGLAGDDYSIKNAITWGRAKFIASLRKYFKLSTSPHWLINTFGVFEHHFVLVSACHFFSPPTTCTIETLCHLATLFLPKRGPSLSLVTTLRELGAVATASSTLALLGDFHQYVCHKLQRDTLECEAIDRCINEFRGQLMLSNQDLVHYIYLSFFQCFNNQKFLSYSVNTSPELLPATLELPPLLVANIDADFKHKMATYYNKQTYLSNYVTIRSVPLHHMEGYAPECTQAAPDRPGPVMWSGESCQVTELLKNINLEYPDACFAEEFQGLMDLAAISSRNSVFGDPRAYMTDSTVRGALPIYRCELFFRHYFMAVFADDTAAFWRRHILLPSESFCRTAPDTALTRAITYTEMYCSLSSLAEQMHVSRHEYFNPKLPVFNWILDLDLPLNAQSLTVEEMHALCVLIRESILDILKLLGEVGPDHEVFFFKSSCLPLYGGEEDMSWPAPSFCTCVKKLGMRVITSFPAGVCLRGSEPMVQLTKVLNRVIKLNCQSFPKISDLQSPNGPFDTGIYGKGRSIRLPYTYKVGKTGQLEQLLKLFVCHPPSSGKWEYIQHSLDLKRLLHHSQSYPWTSEMKTVYRVEDVNEDFLSKHTQKQLPQKQLAVISTLESLTETDLTSFLLTKVWPRCFTTIKSYMSEEKLQQFHKVTFSPSNHCIVQVRPERGNNFKCLKFNHRGSTKTVRVFLTLHLKPERKLIVTFMSQCFANKCQSNKPVAHFSVLMDL
ncbi:primase-like protein [Ovine gammaherpesvirus 2]|uniref:Primase-like protein n=1 Tax=Ovine gammaherpesvirus 2 TaxID=10398 RepID=A1BM46_9GAMA|nr:primase-like protein [Ovine gammaherpesvirus 2]